MDSRVGWPNSFNALAIISIVIVVFSQKLYFDITRKYIDKGNLNLYISINPEI